MLVTGGSGFIGSGLVEAMVDGHKGTMLDDFHTGSMDNLESIREDIRVIKGSCNKCQDLGLEPEIIFHLGIPSSSPMYLKIPFLAERGHK